MTKKMLIDATRHEEVRIAVVNVNGNRLEDFDSESTLKPPIKGNIYLAKVIRVEPALQAAFVDFGGGRHGFLPFSEIHPDYYYIPVGDRPSNAPDHPEDEIFLPPQDAALNYEHDPIGGASLIAPDILLSDLSAVQADIMLDDNLLDDEDEFKIKRPRFYRYKIQEVIKRRQILLVQVLREERGNKGASLTTYLSLPGRYCVLMPNAGQRSGGVSRKITEMDDRKRLKDALADMDLPEGMSVIVRTAGQERNKQELKRDFEYLLRLWSDIRDLTLKSIAPTLVYAEGDIIKRTIRDCYSKDINTILVEGEEAYKAAKSFLKMLMPSHAKRVQHYKEEDLSLFQKFQIEHQVDRMLDPVSPLPSGGSIVINHTEALIAIDVNSGKSTRERHIDETALKTNLEAADEAARQMRLRDLGGLIVIDFIDMNDNKHIHAVEKRFKDAVKDDRARIQIGRISQFGLLELSRQRIRPSIFETNMMPCTHCKGRGNVRSHESMALYVLRGIETAAVSYKNATFTAFVPPDVDLYILNQQRDFILTLESRYGIHIIIQRREDLHASEYQLEITSGSTTFSPSVKVLELPLKEDRKDSRRVRHPSSKERHRAAPSEFDMTLEATLDAELGGKEESTTNGKQRRGHFTQRHRDAKGRNGEINHRAITPHTEPSLLPADLHEQSIKSVIEDNVQESDKQNSDKKGRRRRRRRRGQRGENVGGGSSVPQSLEAPLTTEISDTPLLSAAARDEINETPASKVSDQKTPKKLSRRKPKEAKKEIANGEENLHPTVGMASMPRTSTDEPVPPKKPTRRRKASTPEGYNGKTLEDSQSNPPVKKLKDKTTREGIVDAPLSQLPALPKEQADSAPQVEGADINTQKKRKGWLKRIFEGESS